jgi:hypothetical protein
MTDDPHEQQLMELIESDAQQGMELLMKYLSESPDRWVGAVSTMIALHTASVRYRDLAQENADDPDLLGFFLGASVDVFEHLMQMVGGHPVALQAGEVLKREHPEDL